jgi:hypothetical protein
LKIVEKVGAGCTDWKNIFDYVTWTKLMEILKETGMDWHIIMSKEDIEC